MSIYEIIGNKNGSFSLLNKFHHLIQYHCDNDVDFDYITKYLSEKGISKCNVLECDIIYHDNRYG